VPSLNYAGADARSFEAEMRQRLGNQHTRIESRLLVSGASAVTFSFDSPLPRAHQSNEKV
jgi:hypothetical protein